MLRRVSYPVQIKMKGIPFRVDFPSGMFDASTPIKENISQSVEF